MNDDGTKSDDNRPPSVSREEIWRRIRKNHHLYADNEPDSNVTEGCSAEFAEAMRLKFKRAGEKETTTGPDAGCTH